LDNDSDPDGDSLTANLVTDVAHGDLNLSPNGLFVYAPDSEYSGPDTFTYVANDGTANSAPATVTIMVNLVNSPPVANADEYTVTAGEVLTVAAPGILGNDSDADGDPLTIIQGNGPGNGTLQLNNNGSFTYTPDQGFAGDDTFTYRLSDGHVESQAAVVTIHVEPISIPPIPLESGWVTEADSPGASPNTFPRVGDLIACDSGGCFPSTQVRGFMSYDVASISDNATIYAAQLVLPTTSISGDPFNNAQMGDLLFEAVFYTGTLSYQHYFLDPMQTIHETSSEPMNSVDVSDALQAIIAEGYDHFQVRLRFANDTDDDVENDLYEFLAEPVLEVVYSLPSQ
jgi:hypothetical protein